MALPNMKTFCLATLKPQLRGILDYFGSESEYIMSTQTTQNQKIAAITTDTENLSSRLTETIDSISEVSTRLSELNEEFQAASDFSSLEESKDQITTNTAAITSIRETLQNVQNTLASLTTSVNELSSDVATIQTNLNKVVLSAYNNANNIADIMSAISSYKFPASPSRDGGNWTDSNYTPTVNEYNKENPVR